MFSMLSAGNDQPSASVAADADGVHVLRLDGAVPPVAPVADCSPADLATIAGSVPGYLRDLLQGISTNWLAEFRAAQIVFARFAGVQFRTSDDLPALTVLSSGLRQAIAASGGMRLKFGNDHKGLILLAA